MGAHFSHDRSAEKASQDQGDRVAPTPVPIRPKPKKNRTILLHVYDNGSQRVQVVNKLLRPFNMGIFHCGVEAFGWEWSFSDCTLMQGTLTGLFCCYPMRCRGFNYLETLKLGDTSLSEEQVLRAIGNLEKKWLKSDYHILRNNCYHFCEEFAAILGVNGLPSWVTSLAQKALLLSEEVDHLPSHTLLLEPCGRRCCRQSTYGGLDAHEVEDEGQGVSSAAACVDSFHPLEVGEKMGSIRPRRVS